MVKEDSLVNAKYLMKKFPGKGGWTYVEIPEISQNKNNPFGWVKVKGFIDSYELKQYKLMPMGNERLFLPVKAAIRKVIKKQAGDYVNVILYSDESLLEIPEEILLCFEQESKILYETFMAYTEGERKTYLDWIYSAKTDETKAVRIATMMSRLQKKLRFYDNSKVK